jgi:glycerophosphoryl diester phosphodiesterase
MTLKLATWFAFFFVATMPALAGPMQRGKVQLFCHRTANRDTPENTLESLALAARMGCNLVEIDIRMTLDGELVLNHDGMLERLTDGMGDVETASLDELRLYDFGGWMSDRFSSMRIARFTDALRIAREQGIALDLDVKEKGYGPQIFAALRSEGMLERVVFGGEGGNSDDLKRLYPAANADPTEWFGPSPTTSQIATAHANGKFVVANFSDNPQEMNLAAMRAAVSAGVDAINVDYPRLGAEAIGRPVEDKLAALAAVASAGPIEKRTAAIREVSRYTGFPTQSIFTRLLLDPNQQISRAAAVALVVARPATPAKVFVDALSSESVTARRNAAWGLGTIHAPATSALLPLLQHRDVQELKEVLLALSKCPGDVSASAILPFLQHDAPTVRAAAALALAAHQPAIAAREIPLLLQREEESSAANHRRRLQRGKQRLTQAEIDPIIELYRLHMKLIQALALLPATNATPLLAKEAFRSAEDSSHVTSVPAGYELWDRIAANPELAIAALDSPVPEVADRAEWILVKADPSILPSIRSAMPTASTASRARLIRILAWQGDAAAIPLLQSLEHTDKPEAEFIAWAIQKIEVLQFKP